jgi:hypothetical protein
VSVASEDFEGENENMAFLDSWIRGPGDWSKRFELKGNSRQNSETLTVLV